jgi:cholera toxin transcriptional activator
VVTGTVKHIKSTESDTLYLLLSNEGQYVTKKTIMHKVWGGRIVSENNITQAISQLRFLFGDSGKEQKVIKTKLREGYMLLPGNIILNPPIISKVNFEKEKKQTTDNIDKSIRSYLLNDNIQIIKNFHRKYATKTVQNLLLLLSLLLATVNFHNIYDLLHQKKGVVDFPILIKKEGKTQFHLDQNNASNNLYLYLKGNTPNNISHIFIFKNPDSFYLSCIFYNKKFNQNKAGNISFTNNYPFEFILGKIHETCN